MKGLHEYAPIYKIQMLSWLNILSADTVKLECETWYCCLTLQCPTRSFSRATLEMLKLYFIVLVVIVFALLWTITVQCCCFSLEQSILFYFFLSSLLKLRMFDLLPLVHDSETFFVLFCPFLLTHLDEVDFCLQ